MALTIEQIRKNDHITSDEIRRDIVDTEAEIFTMQAELEHLEATPQASRDYRLNELKATARRSGIAARREFVEKLEQILRYRGPEVNDDAE